MFQAYKIIKITSAVNESIFNLEDKMGFGLSRMYFEGGESPALFAEFHII